MGSAAAKIFTQLEIAKGAEKLMSPLSASQSYDIQKKLEAQEAQKQQFGGGGGGAGAGRTRRSRRRR